MARQNELRRWVEWKCPVSMPEYFWHRAGGARLYYVALVFPLLGWAIAGFVNRRFMPYLSLLLLTQALVVAFLWIWPRYVRKQIIQELQANDNLMCLCCGYPLVGLDRQVCPECGHIFDPHEIRENWKFWVEHRRLPKRSTPPLT